MANTWGGSWGSSWGDSWGAGAAPPIVVQRGDDAPPRRERPKLVYFEDPLPEPQQPAVLETAQEPQPEEPAGPLGLDEFKALFPVGELPPPIQYNVLPPMVWPVDHGARAALVVERARLLAEQDDDDFLLLSAA